MKTKVSAVIARPCVMLLLLLVIALTACMRSPEQKRAKFLAEGKELYNKKDYVRAILQFKGAIKVAPQDPESYYQLSLAYLGVLDLKPAILSLRKALELNPNYTPAQLKMADLLTSTRDKELLEEAEKRLHDVLATSPVNEDALNILGVTEWHLGKREDAEHHLMQALIRFPQDLRAAIALVQMKLLLKDFKGAEELLKHFAADNPKFPEPVLALGELYRLAGKAVEGEQQFRRALAIDPKNNLALFDLAGLQFQAGRMEEAERTYSQLSALPDRQYKPMHAIFLFESGKRDLAIAEFEKLAKDDPADRAARDRLMQAYYNANRKGDVEKVLATALHKNANDVDALLQRSRLYLDVGRYAEAQNDLAKVLHFKPDSAEAHYMRAKVYENSGAALQQKQELHDTIRLAPGFLMGRLELAGLFLKSQAPKSALEILNSAPPDQQKLLPLIIERNWANLAVNDMIEFRKGLDQAKAMARVPDVLLQDAQWKVAQHDYQGARESLDEVLQQSPEDVRAMDLLVRSYSAEKQALATAIGRIQKHADQHPRSAQVNYFLGKLLMAGGDRAGARRSFEVAKKADATFFKADERLAQLDLAEGKLGDARKRLAGILFSTVSRETQISVELQLLVIEEEAGDYPSAIQHCRRILELEPDNIKALSDLAELLVNSSNQMDEALKLAQRGKEVAPENPYVTDTLGWVLYRKGLYTLALQHFEYAASSKDAIGIHKGHLALAYFKLGRQREGKLNLDAALKLDPNLSRTKLYQELMAESNRTQR